MSIEAVMKKHEMRLLKLPNVTGVGLGEKNGKSAIIVFVQKKVPESELDKEEVIPKVLDGYETSVEPEIRVGR